MGVIVSTVANSKAPSTRYASSSAEAKAPPTILLTPPKYDFAALSAVEITRVATEARMSAVTPGEAIA